MKKIDIFIRTYHKDLEWLQYCLRSIQKFVTGYNQIIICIPEDDAHLITEWNLTKEKIVQWIPATKNGYIDQQISKLHAFTMSDADYILYVDSDVIFHSPTDLSEYFVWGKPYLMKTRYELVGDAICWKAETEKILGVEVNYEYMRRIPLLYKRSTLENLDKHVDVMTLAKLERLSEFNLIGAFIANYESDQYYMIDTEKDEFPKLAARQFWSWGGITEEIINEINQFLK